MDKQNTFNVLLTTLELLRSQKPEEHSEYARRYAVTITELEKVVAYFYTYIISPPIPPILEDKSDG